MSDVKMKNKTTLARMKGFFAINQFCPFNDQENASSENLYLVEKNVCLMAAICGRKTPGFFINFRQIQRDFGGGIFTTQIMGIFHKLNSRLIFVFLKFHRRQNYCEHFQIHLSKDYRYFSIETSYSILIELLEIRIFREILQSDTFQSPKISSNDLYLLKRA